MVAIWERLFRQTLRQLNSSDHWTLTWQEGPFPPGPQWKEYREHASARFRCSHCKHSWNSVHVTLFFYMNLQRRTVKGRILKQYCKDCSDEVSGKPDFEVEDIESILHNLLIHIRRCYGKYVDDELWPVPLRGSTQGHHRSDLCEACRLRVCIWTSPKRGPAWYAGRQQPQWHKSKEHFEIPIEDSTSKSKNKPVHEYRSWSCCDYFGCILIGLLALFVIRILLFWLNIIP